MIRDYPKNVTKKKTTQNCHTCDEYMERLKKPECKRSVLHTAFFKARQTT